MTGCFGFRSNGMGSDVVKTTFAEYLLIRSLILIIEGRIDIICAKVAGVLHKADGLQYSEYSVSE